MKNKTTPKEYVQLLVYLLEQRFSKVLQGVQEFLSVFIINF